MYEPTASSEAPIDEPPAAEPPAEPPANEPPPHEAPVGEVAAEQSPTIYSPGIPAAEPVADEATAEAQPADEAASAPPEESELESVPPEPSAPLPAMTEAVAEGPAPRTEPWSPESDPWGMSSDTWPPVAADEAAAVPEPAATEPLGAGDPGSEPAPPIGPEEATLEEAGAAAAMSGEPQVLDAEAVAEDESPTAEGVPTADAEADEDPAPKRVSGLRAIFGAAAAAPPAATEATPDAEPVDEALAGEREADDEDDERDRLASAGLAALALDAIVTPGPEPEATEPEAQSEAPAWADASSAAAAAEGGPAEEEAADDSPADEPDERARLASAGLAALAFDAIVTPEPPRERPEPEPESHAPPWAAALFGDDPPASVQGDVEQPATATPRAEPVDEVWPSDPDAEDVAPVGDHTQVYGTDWVPPPVAAHKAKGELEPAAGAVRTSLADADVATEPPSTAEQAVPWLIGLILLLAGMVIVLLALIFAGDASLGGAATLPSGSGDPSPTLMAGSLDSPSAEPSPSAASSAAPTVTPVPAPQYGPLEMIYQGRAAALAPIYLLRRDFTIDEDPAVLAQDANLDVHRHAWSPDGRVGAGLLSDVLVSIEPGKEKRRLGDGISTLTFGDDASTVYAVRVTEDGGNDVASVLAINFASGDTEELASVTYAHPQATEEVALKEAQFLDDGGMVRIFWMDGGMLRLWSLGGGTWTIDPASGKSTEIDEALPQLWSADGHHHIAVTEKDGTSTLTLSNGSDAVLATTTVKGLVSHLRWSPDGERVVFTVGHATSGGGVLQDLYLWDLGDGEAPMQLTSTGAAFGAEWLGTTPHWAAS